MNGRPCCTGGGSQISLFGAAYLTAAQHAQATPNGGSVSDVAAPRDN